VEEEAVVVAEEEAEAVAVEVAELPLQCIVYSFEARI
jgi:hypothetical protein